WPLGERAELALERAQVRVVDVARAHEGDRVAARLLAQLVGERGHRGDLGPARGEQRDELVLAGLLAELYAFDHLAHRPAGNPEGGLDVGNELRWRRIPT